MGINPFVANMASIDGTTAWICGLNDFGNSKILKTSDGGVTWVDNSPPFDPVTSWVDYMHIISPAKIVVIGDPRDGEFEVYYTGNAGVVWTKVPAANLPDPLSGEFGYNNVGDAVGNTIWFGTNQGRVYRSQNGGIQWSAFSTPAASSGLLSFADKNYGLLTENVSYNPAQPISKIYHTEDGGENWTDITPPNIAIRIQGIEYIPNTPYIIMNTTDGNILNGPFRTWLSKDRGATWEQISTGENVGWITFKDTTNGWGVEPQPKNHLGQIFKYRGPLVGLLSTANLDANVTVFPNPTADFVQIDLQNAKISTYWCLLNDAQGRLIQKIVIPAAANFSQKINLNGLPAGTYHVTVASEKGSIVKQVVKQ
jgi:photosystem II stability/assembly factor-like uncharacterized protein